MNFCIFLKKKKVIYKKEKKDKRRIKGNIFYV